MWISELADELCVAPSTVRFYERIGLLPAPLRNGSGYRVYDDEAAARLRFVVLAKRIGLTLEQIADVLPIWGGTNCAATRDEMTRLVKQQHAEVLDRIQELQSFADALDAVRAALEESTPPAACRADLSCCVPAPERVPIPPPGRRAAAKPSL